MKIDVHDTYATSKNGNTIHFDVLLPHGSSKETALRYARQFLDTIGESLESLKSERCNFCHTESANPAVAESIERTGHYILQMEGCPNLYR